MRDLLPLSAYERTARAATARTAVIMSLLWGIPMTGYLVYARGNLSLGAALATGILGACVFGVGWAFWMRATMTKLMRRLYAADPKLVPAAPSAGYDARLPANWMDSRVAIGGHLYVRKHAVQFVPHTKNLKAHQAAKELLLNEPPQVEIVERQSNALQRMFQPGPIQLLRVGDSSHAMTFLVPDPSEAAKVILNCLR